MTQDPDHRLSQHHHWSKRYQDHRDPWDQGTYHPVLEDLVHRHPHTVIQQKILVIGAGPGHDAQFLSHFAREVLPLDFSPEAKKSFQKYYPDSPLDYRVQDFFDLPDELVVDSLLEHTMLCAISPQRREDYFRSVKKVVKPGGFFVGIIWNLTSSGEGGPPYSIPNELVLKGLGKEFEILWNHPVDKTYPGREGTETLLIAQAVRASVPSS